MSTTENLPQQNPGSDMESPERPEMPEYSRADAKEDSDSGEPEEDLEEPSIKEFADSSDYLAGDLNEEAYGKISDKYRIDEDAEEIFIGDSTWNDVDDLLSEDNSSNSWSGRIRGYLDDKKDKLGNILFDHDNKYTAGGLGLMGLGYAAGAGIATTAGSLIFGWGLGGYIGNYIFGNDQSNQEEDNGEETLEDPEHELASDKYSDWEIKVVDESAYEEAAQEYVESQE